MDLLMIVSTPEAEPIACSLALAAGRSELRWGVFLTNDGVKVLSNNEFAEALNGADVAIACQESWQHHMGDDPCPVELGSQTNNSLAVAEAAKIVSL